MEYYVDDIIDGNSLTLEEYLEILLSNRYKKVYPNNCFPSNDMFDKFILRIKEIPDSVIFKIIYRFLVKEGAYGTNILHKKFILENKENIKILNEDLPIYTQRLLKRGKPWEGLTWLLDLLPSNPRGVLNVLDAFFETYCQFVPDDVLFGLSNIDQIIRAKYFDIDRPNDLLYNITPYEFEYLVAELFSSMGYEIEITKKSHDNGIDIIAKNNNLIKKELLVIQCKRYKQNITVKDIRELLGVIELNKATKGIFCTSSDYTPASKKISSNSNRIELLNGIEIIKLCNENLSTNWHTKIGTFCHKYSKSGKNY